MDKLAGGKMERVRQAMELAVREQWAAEPRLDSPPARALDEATVASRPVMLAEIARRASPPAPGPSVLPALVRPPAAEVPRIRTVDVAAHTLAEQRLVAALAGSPEREAFCVLQAAAAKALDERNATTLGVTGPRTGAGKTLTAANLAIALVKDGRRKVVLVDLDLRRPAVHAKFGVAAAPGIEDCLFEGTGAIDALFSPGIDGLAVLPARGGSRNVAQIMRSSNLAELLAGLKKLRAGSLVVLDLPPIADQSDAAAFEQLADALLLVVEDGVSKEREYRHVTSAISPSKLLGTVLNRADG